MQHPHRTWTVAEESALRRMIDRCLPLRTVADTLDRKIGSIRHKMIALGLGINRKRWWSNARDNELRHLVNEGNSDVEIASVMKRTRIAIKRRREKLGLSLGFRIDSGEIAKIAVLFERGETVSEVSRQTGRSKAGLSVLRDRLGIKRLSKSVAQSKAEERKRAMRSPHAPNPAEGKTLAVLTDGPKTVAEIMTALDRSESSVRQWLAALREKCLAFCEDVPGSDKYTQWVSVWWWLEANAGLVYKMAHRIARRNPGVDFEDIATEIRIKAALCARTFRPHGSKFGTYAINSATHHATYFAVAEHRRGIYVPKHVAFEAEIGKPPLSISDFSPTDDDRAWEPEQPEQTSPVMDPEFWDKVRAVIAKHEPRLAEMLIGYYRDGKIYDQLGNGLSKERVRQLVERAKDLLIRSGVLREYVA